jgi:RNA polymerase sigma-70 factor (ECF subfamily)
MFSSARNKIENLPDLEIIERYRHSHDNIYIGILYKRYAHLVLGTCFNYLKSESKAEDALSGIFELLMVELKKHKIQNFKSWLYTLSKNYCLQELRKDKNLLGKENAYENFLKENMESDAILHPINDKAAKEKIFIALEKALIALKYNQQVCLKMFYFENKSYADINKETGFSLKEIKSNIQNGKRNLLIKMQESNE